jgi:Uma2 family endonuclease
MNRMTAPLPGTVPDPKYPDSDGRPMGDTDFHNLALIDLRQKLEDRFAGVPDVYIASNLILYYKEGDPSKRRDPDILFAKGVIGNHKRRFFRIWEEKVVPSVLWEVLSRKTWRIDIDSKRRLYARIRVKEYFMFDPEIRYLNPPLQGFRLVNGKSLRIKPNRDGSLTSKELGLRFLAAGDHVRVFDVRTGEEILSREEQIEAGRAQAKEEKERAKSEKERADLASQLLKAEHERADLANQLLKVERERADKEKKRADDLEVVLQRLRDLETEVQRLKKRPSGG